MKIHRPDFDWTFIIYFLAGAAIGNIVLGVFK
jgi:hypothetical protein